jgi:hypothetical protein
LEVVPAVKRKLLDRLLVDDLAEIVCLLLKECRLPRDRDGLAAAPWPQLEAQRDDVVNPQVDPLANQFLEARELHLDVVASRLKQRGDGSAMFVRDQCPDNVSCVAADHLDGRARHDAARGVHNRDGDLAGRGLRSNGNRDDH